MDTSTVLCDVCKIQAKKYKCPKCLIIYCSIGCYKNHIEICSTRAEEFAIADIVGNINPCHSKKNKPEEDMKLEELGDKVSKTQLHKLADSDRLKELFQNKHLRDYLKKLNDSHMPERDMENAMKEPIFLEFADECLQVIENS